MEVKKINIKDLSLLKVTRVREWSICFDYADKHYLIHGGGEAGECDWQELYERTLDNCGRYKLTFMNKKNFEREDVAYDYFPQHYRKPIVYKHIDKEYFAYKLTKKGFATGIMENKVVDEQKRIDYLRCEIKKYHNKIQELQAEIDKLK